MFSFLEEQFRSGGFRSRFNNPNRINAPTFIHRIINPDRDDVFLPGRGMNHPQKNIDGVPIDQEIPEDVFHRLNGLDKIELRSSCQGQDPEHPTFIIFRLRSDNTEDKVKQVVDKINNAKNNLLAGYNLGNDNQYRIGVTAKDTWAGKPEYHDFWNELPNTIDQAVS